MYVALGLVCLYVVTSFPFGITVTMVIKCETHIYPLSWKKNPHGRKANLQAPQFHNGQRAPNCARLSNYCPVLQWPLVLWICSTRSMTKLDIAVFFIVRASLSNQSSWSKNYNDVIMSPVVSQSTGISIVYSTVCSGADQRKQRSE